LGWFSNPFLVLAVASELLTLLAFLFVRPLATLLGQSPPSRSGLLTAMLAIPAVLLADLFQKHFFRSTKHTARS
ncbi:MAG TPA: hypothetical protein VFU68_06715, partial [Terracidiphilus sp.]|nr:hypothetical protein [Terracidiphilus sp.]